MTAATDTHYLDQIETPSMQIGGFSGYNRRPLPDRSGFTAQFFGENGDDADMISALSLTKFLDSEVYVRVFLVKDSVGQIMKSNGTFPSIASFKGKIQRPKGMKDGMIAQLFAPNGPDADQVNNLGLSKYLDSFVFVEILKPEAAPSIAQVDSRHQEALLPDVSTELEALTQHLTPFERKALAKRSKAYHEANRLLKMSGFLRQPSVWAVLGTEIDFQSWVETCPCCAAGDTPCGNKSSFFKIPAEAHIKYMLIPLCQEHAHAALHGQLQGGLPFMRMRRDYLIQEWAWERILSTVGTPIGIDDPDPQKLFSWASQSGLTQHIPANYLNKLT